MHALSAPLDLLHPNLSRHHLLEMAATFIPGQISLVIAITGHRDLAPEREHLDSIRERLASFLRKQAELYPNTPILVITGMAEGADQLAIEVVRNLKHPRITYRPVLPMPEEVFVMDFTCDEARTIFREQMAGQTIVELPIHPGFNLNDLREGRKDARAQQFRNLADFLIESSQILIAIWDDESPSKAGGTTEVVQRKLSTERTSSFNRGFEGQHSSLGLIPFGTGSVFHISAHRAGAKFHAPALEDELLLPPGTNRNDFYKIYLLFDEYNFDVATHPMLGKIADSKARSLTSGKQGQDLTPAMLWCRTVRGWSAALAEHYQTQNRRLLKTIFALIFLLGLAIHFIEPFSKGHGRPFEADLVFFVCTAIGILILFAIDKGYGTWLLRSLTRRFLKAQPPRMPIGGLQRRRKHEDYRALAEALRVQFYWFAAGVPNFAGNSYLDKHAGDMIWVRDATSEALLAFSERAVSADDGYSFSHSLARSWLQGQINYFKKKGVMAEHAHRLLNRFAWSLAVPTFLCPIVLFVFCQFAPGGVLMENLTIALTFIPALLLLISVILWNFGEITGYEQEGQQARQMHRLFTAAVRQFDALLCESNRLSADDPDHQEQEASVTRRIRILLERIGKDALIENGDWLALHRGRDFKLNRTAG